MLKANAVLIDHSRRPHKGGPDKGIHRHILGPDRRYAHVTACHLDHDTSQEDTQKDPACYDLYLLQIT